MKKIIAVLAVVAVLVGVALVVPSFIDWNAYRGEIAAEVKKATGRDIAIDGRIDVALLPTPKLSLTKTRFANLEGAAEPDMVRLDALDLRIALMPLLSGKVVVQSVVLKGADIRLEQLADGRTNWTFGAAEKRRGGGAGTGGQGVRGTGDGDRVSLEQVVIEKSALSYRDARTGTVKRFKSINARIAAATLSGPFAARGNFQFGGVPVKFELQAGRIVAFASTKVTLAAELPDAKAKSEYVGYLTPGKPGFTFSGRVSSAGPDLANLVSLLARAGGGKMAPPPQVAHPFRIAADVKGGQEGVAVSGLTAEINGTRVAGSVNVALGAGTDIDAVLKVNRLDLDRWLVKAGKSGAKAGATKGKKRSGRKAKDFALPRGLNLTIEADVGGLVYRKGLVRDVQFRGRLDKKAATLTRLSARLPGGSDAALSGRLTARQGKPRFDGRVRLDSSDFRALVRWLGGDDGAIAPDRLRKLRFRSGIGFQPAQVELRDMDLRFDASRVAGGMVVALRDRVGLGARLNIDQLNVDAYFPAKKTAKKTAEKTPAGSGAGKAGKSPAMPAMDGGLAALGGFDANLSLTAGQLTYQGERHRDIRLEGTLLGGNLELRRLSVSDLAGAKAEAKGTIRSIDKSPLPDLSVNLSTAKPGRLMRWAGVEAPLAPEQFAPFSLKGAIKAEKAATRLDIGLTAGKLHVSAKGKLAALTTAPRVDLNFSAKHPEFLTFVRLFDPKFAPEKAVEGPFQIAAAVTGTGLDFKLEKFETRLGRARLTGAATLSMAGLRPKLRADLVGDEVIVDHFLNAPERDPQKRREPRGNAGRSTPGAPWSEEPLDLGLFRALDADVRIRAKTIAWRRWQVAEPRLDITLEDGRFDMRRLAGRMVGGSFHMTGGLAAPAKAGQPAAVRFDLDAAGVDLKQALFNAADIDIAKGRVNFKMAVTGQGGSTDAIARSLAGSGSLLAVDGEVKGFDLARVNEQVDKLSDVASLLSFLRSAMSGGTTRFSRLSGTFKVTDGVARSNDISLVADGGTGTGQLKADIGRWWMDGEARFRLSGKTGAPPFGLQLKGPLDAPKRKIRAAELEAWLAKRAAGALIERFVAPKRDTGTAGGAAGAGGQGQPAPAPQPQPSSRDQFIRGIFDILKQR